MLNFIKLHNKMIRETGEIKQRNKLVKSSKGWLKITLGTLFAGAALFTFTGMNSQVHADADNLNTQTSTQETQIKNDNSNNEDNKSTTQTTSNPKTTDNQNENVTPTNKNSDSNSTVATDKPAPVKSPIINLSKQDSSYTLPVDQNVRDAASINGTVTGRLGAGYTIYYDHSQDSDGYTWLHYKNYTGADRWIADLTNQYNNSDNDKLVSSLPGAQYGIDVSSYQGTDLSSYAQQGAKYAIVKITEGTNYVNPNAAGQIASAKANGMTVMAYGFAHIGADDNAAKNEANYFIQNAQALGVPANSYLACDYEVDASSDMELNTNAVLTYMNTLHNAGYKPLIYSNAYYFDTNLDNNRIINAYPNSLWIASYTGSGRDSQIAAPTEQGVLIWQYTDNRNGQGVDGDVTFGPLSTTPTVNNQPATTTNQNNNVSNTTSNNVSGSYTLPWSQNVRNGASLSAGITGQLQAGYTVYYDGTVEADGYTWLHYISYTGADRYVADMNSVNIPAQQAVANPIKTSDNGIYTLPWSQNVRNGASLNAGVTGQLQSGYQIRYDGTIEADGYTWLHYISYTGADRWIADMNTSNIATNNNEINTSGAYTLPWTENVRDNSTIGANITGQLQAGYTVYYDATVQADGYTWLHYQNFNGDSRWVAYFA